MLFSIVVPVYNVEKYIDKCMDSLLNQNYEDYEIILVDDGSTDSCPEICEAYSKKYDNVRAIHQVNGGLSDARNTGIKNAAGKYICFVDSDDYWSTPEALNLISEAAKDDPDIIRIEKQKYLENKDEFIENGIVDFRVHENLTPGKTLMSLISSDELKEAAWLLIPKREYLLKYDLFFKKGIKSEDIEWSIRLYSHEPKWGFVSERIYVYRIGRAGSISNTIGYKHLSDCCDSLESSAKVIRSCTGDTKRALSAFMMYNAVITCAHVANSKMSNGQKKELYSRLKLLCSEYLTDNIIGKKLKLAGTVYKVAGFRAMCLALGMFLKIRGR